MSTLSVLFLLTAMAATLLSLLGGLFFMARGRADDARRSNRFMQGRVVLQGAALALFALAYLLH
jgi:hypothetical protein